MPDHRVKEILKALHDAVLFYDEDKAVEWAKVALEEGLDPFTAVMEGLSSGMKQVGELYEKGDYFVPELLLCADALYAGLGILQPAIEASDTVTATKGSIVLGVVEGDVHDIGKNLVKTMFEAAGWTVYDLGKDVPLDRFVEEQERTGAEIVGMSALMTTSMCAMPIVINKLRERNARVRVILGGAPINANVAEKFGADGYAEDAVSAVDEAVRLLSMPREQMREGRHEG